MKRARPNVDIDGLQSSEAVRFICDAFPFYLSYVDKTYRYRFLNKAYEDRLRVHRSELVGRKITEVWDETLSQRLIVNVDRALAGEELTVELNVGDISSITSYVPHRGVDGEVLGVLVFSQDITELSNSRAALLQSEKVAAMGRLAASMLHEINTPLAVLKNNNALVKRTIENMRPDAAVSKPVQIRQLADLIDNNEAAIDRIVGISKRLRRFTRIDEAATQEIDVHECIDSAVEFLQPQSGSRIVLHKQYGNVPRTWARPADLNHLFLNILTNAKEAIEEQGSITIRTSADRGRIQIAVQDTGRGIPADKLERLFQPGFSHSGKRVKASLGLFVCQDIVAQHQGEIKVESTPNQGTTFTIVLPVQTAASQP